MSRLRKAAKATVVAQLFNWLGLALSLVTVPLYLEWLGQERYGLLLTGLAFSSYLMFTDAGISWASMLLIAQANGRDDRSGIAAIVRTSFPLAALSALVVFFVVGTLSLLLDSSHTIIWVPAHPEFPGLLIAIGASVVFTLGFSPFYNLFIGLQEAHLAGIYQGAGRLSGTLAAVAIAAGGAPLGWVFSGNVAGAFLAGLCAAIHCRRRHPWAFTAGPFWNPAQVRQQLRTGAKSMAMQGGNVLWVTAPVFAISFVAGPRFVPYYSIPMTLLNAPLGILNSFSASLQAGYGEAMGRGETLWIAETVERILRKVLLLLGILGGGFFLLAGPFVELWTGGKIVLEPEMLAGVFFIAAVGAFLGMFRFTLTGINRHRLASVSDFLGGILAMIFSVAVVRHYGPNGIGLGVVLAAVLTGAWVFPRELKRNLGGPSFWPSARFWCRASLIIVASLTIGSLSMVVFTSILTGLPGGSDILVSGLVMTGVFAGLTSWILPEEFEIFRSILQRFHPRTA